MLSTACSACASRSQVLERLLQRLLHRAALRGDGSSHARRLCPQLLGLLVAALQLLQIGDQGCTKVACGKAGGGQTDSASCGKKKPSSFSRSVTRAAEQKAVGMDGEAGLRDWFVNGWVARSSLSWPPQSPVSMHSACTRRAAGKISAANSSAHQWPAARCPCTQPIRPTPEPCTCFANCQQTSALTGSLPLGALHAAKQALQLAGGGLEGRQRTHIVRLGRRQLLLRQLPGKSCVQQSAGGWMRQWMSGISMHHAMSAAQLPGCVARLPPCSRCHPSTPCLKLQHPLGCNPCTPHRPQALIPTPLAHP